MTEEEVQELEDLTEMARYSWVYGTFDDYGFLHAIGEDAEPDVAYWCHRGPTLCGLNQDGQTTLQPPGFMSRMGTPRCTTCCKLTGLPPGIGSPKNDDVCRDMLGLDNGTS